MNKKIDKVGLTENDETLKKQKKSYLKMADVARK